jgi:hypothetical protein
MLAGGCAQAASYYAGLGLANCSSRCAVVTYLSDREGKCSPVQKDAACAGSVLDLQISSPTPTTTPQTLTGGCKDALDWLINGGCSKAKAYYAGLGLTDCANRCAVVGYLRGKEGKCTLQQQDLVCGTAVPRTSFPTSAPTAAPSRSPVAPSSRPTAVGTSRSPTNLPTASAAQTAGGPIRPFVGANFALKLARNPLSVGKAAVRFFSEMCPAVKHAKIFGAPCVCACC